MSLYYFHAQMLNKAKQSAVAKAAYISNESLYSERDETVKAYKRRNVAPESFIIAPSHAPSWVYNRETLWNEVEKVEKQYNSQISREIVAALPVELKPEEQTELIREFVQENFVSKGMVADVNIHRDQEHNPHVHILLTVRPFNEDGSWWKNKSKKEYLFDDEGQPILKENGKQKDIKIDLTGWNNKSLLLEWRENFSNKINEYYKSNNIDKSVSHLSYEEQGLDIKAKQRLSRSEYYVEKKAEEKAINDGKEYVPVTQYGKINQEINQYNKQIQSIQKEIDALEQYKSNINEIQTNKFENIRKLIPLDQSHKKAISFVKNRQKVSYVNFDVTHKAIKSLSYWKKKIDKEIRAIEREENILKTVQELYGKSSPNLVRYGFANENFVEQYNAKLESIKDSYNKVTKEVNKYKESYSLTVQAHSLQKDILRKEFTFLYPEYKSFCKIDSPEMNDLFNKYVNLYKENNSLVNSIPEYENHSHVYTGEEQKFRSEISDIISRYKEHSKAHFSLPKQLDSQEKSYINIVKEKSNSINQVHVQDEIYNHAVQYLQTKNEIKHNENHFIDVKNNMYNGLIELYGIEHKEVIEKIPDRIKVKLLESYLENKEIDSLHEELAKVNWKEKNRTDSNNKDKSNADYIPFTNQKNIGAAAGGLIDDLIQQAKENENKYDDLEKQRKNKRRKGKNKNLGLER